MEDNIKNKEKLYGRYEDQNEAVAEIVKVLDKLRGVMATGHTGLSPEETVDYTIIALKLTRSVTAQGESAKDSWLDLANYSRLVCRRRTGVDIASDFKAISDSVLGTTDMSNIVLEEGRR